MIYWSVKWKHSLESEPVLIYSELDEKHWEQRKVEVFSDGSMGYASKNRSSGGSFLSEEPLPSLQEIALDQEFEPIEVNQQEFEQIWESAQKSGN